MDVPDQNEDLEALRGVKRCLSSDNLHKDIVPPKKMVIHLLQTGI